MGIFTRKKDGKKELKELLDGYELPTFSTVVIKVLSLLRDKECPMTTIAQELVLDPALVVSVFKMVNSSAFGLIHKVADIPQAVMLLGRARVESIVLSHAVRKALPKVHEPWFNMNTFWEVSGRRAALARNFAQVLHPESAISSFTSAMLQDIGMPVLIAAKSKIYTSIYEQWSETGEIIVNLEKEHLTLDHQQVGRIMAEEWNFPELLTDVIGDHHFSTTIAPAISLVSHLELQHNEGQLDYIISHCEDQYSLKPESTKEIIEQALKEASTISL